MLVLVLIAQSWSAFLDSSLIYIGLTGKDIALRADYSIRDDYRFAVIDEILQDPLYTMEFTDEMESLFHDKSQRDILKHLVSFYDIDLRYEKYPFLKSLAKSHQALDHALADTCSRLSDTFEALTLYSSELTASIEEEKSNEEQYDSLVSYLQDHAQTVNYAELFRAGAFLAGAAENYTAWLESIKLHPQSIRDVAGSVLFYNEYEFGSVVIGDSNDNTYSGDFTVIIDLGGDDTYHCTAQKNNIQLIIDQSGDDIYEGKDRAIACGYFGVSILLDEAGDDIYRAEDYSLGCGIFGLGWLIDRSGSDSYYGDSFTQGAGGFGIGILSDYDGNDLYQGALHAQGFASTYGLGIVDDHTGNDRYIILEKYTDEIRYLDHYLSLAQGFSIGFRPDLSGGIGLILEGSGNDYYLSDIFAQGSSYWYGIGAIVDAGGNDTYVSYQYAQGAGVHIAVGALVDKAGDDNYISKGVSQGCGHDLAFGFLYDRSGDDSYVAFDLSQGAGNANGIGLLIDENGDDAYSVKRDHNTQGYGDFRREYGSIGLLIDIKGSDTYYSGLNAAFWKKGEYGLGIDWE